MTHLHSQSKQSGFTIVELLVVIVVIGILAAITVISYTGISQRAAVATLQSDLKNASTQLGMDNASNDQYPSSEAEANSGQGLSKSPGTTYSYTVVGSGYCLSATSDAADTTYHISSGGAIESGGCTLAWVQVATGYSHTCGIASNNLAYCWGRNSYGQLGNNSIIPSNVPIEIDMTGVLSGKTIKSISANYDHTCAISSDDLAYCWGSDTYGQLGDNLTTQSNVPVAVNISGVLSGKTVKSIEAGFYHTCAIASDDQAYCWGRNNYGQLGDNSTSESHVPVAVNTSGVLNGKTTKTVRVGYFHSCVVASDDQSYCWGYNGDGELGNNLTSQSTVPVSPDTTGLLSGKTILAVATGGAHTCVIASDNNVYCWGGNNRGPLGNNSITRSLVPVAVNTDGVLSGKSNIAITAGNDFTCSVDSDGLPYCWGRNLNGQLGNSSTIDSLVPVSVNTSGVLSGKTIGSISGASYGHTCSIASDNLVYCWGYNGYGQLGDGTNNQSTVPVATEPLLL